MCRLAHILTWIVQASIKWQRVLLNNGQSSVAYFLYPSPHNILEHSCLDNSIEEKCQSITFPLLLTTPRTFTVLGNLICTSVGTSFSSLHNHLLFITFTFYFIRENAFQPLNVLTCLASTLHSSDEYHLLYLI